MTTHTLHVTFGTQEGAMLRLMGLIHRRGFEVVGVDMPPGATNGLRSASITLEAKGPGFRIDVLEKQVARLIEIKSVRVIEPLKRRNILNFFRMRHLPSGADVRTTV